MNGSDLRALTHMAAGGLCVTLAWLPASAAIAIAAVAVAFNLWVLPRLAGGRFRRQGSAWGPSDRGLVLYPLCVLALLVLLPERPTLVASSWALLAFGDSAASLVGRRLGRPRLPWNPHKSVAGSLAFLIFGGGATCLLLCLSASGRLAFRDGPGLARMALAAGSDPAASSAGWWVLLALIAAGVLALLESLPSGLDDNLIVPCAAAPLLLGLTAVTPAGLARGAEIAARLWPSALAVTLVAGIAAYLLRWVSLSGLVAGVAVGCGIAIGLGWWGFVLLLAFFLIGSLATRAGWRAKSSRGIAQERGGARGSLHALANGAVPALCALFALAGAPPVACALAFAGALGAAAFDTAASEIGKWAGGATFLPERLAWVAPGTPGGVSLAGTLAGAAAAALIAALAGAGGLVPGGWVGAATVWIAAAIGAFSERPVALLGAIERPHPESLNVANTLVGAAVALWLGHWLLPAVAASMASLS
ncbi:MAG: DUF92 domain-containing protein [Acidobacteriota bacterium]